MIFVFNGPPGSGKDHSAEFLEKEFGYEHLMFKTKLFEHVLDYYKVDSEWFFDGYNDRSKKEIKEPRLNNLSRREALIYVSDHIIKPKYGKYYFGTELLNKIDPEKHYVISDLGFVEEVQPLINKLGTNKLIIISLFRDGCDFANDSRNYIGSYVLQKFILLHESFHIKQPERTISSLFGYHIHNNGSVEQLEDALRQIHIKEEHVARYTKEKDFL